MQAAAERPFAPAIALDQAGRELHILRKALAQARREIAHLRTIAEQDSLTGLANRHRLMAEIETAIDQHMTYGRPTALLFIDMDGLKYLNDHFGHCTGDAAITHVAQILRESVPHGLVARLAGDEFAIVLAGATATEAGNYAQAIACNITDSPLCHNDCQHRLAISIGVAPVENGDTTRTLLARADAAMYADKRRRLPQNQAARSAR